MNSPELIVLALNTVVICIAYFIIYPNFCGSDLLKVGLNDCIASGICLMVAASLFMGSGTEFSLLITSVNWFWFTLLSYLTLEMPLMIWYGNKYDLWSSFKP